MQDFFSTANLPLIGGAAVVIMLLAWLWYRHRRGGDRLKRVLADISHDRIDGLVIPNGDDGEIQIDHLLLTTQGLLIVDIKDAVGTVFGSDKMKEWATKTTAGTEPSGPNAPA